MIGSTVAGVGLVLVVAALVWLFGPLGLLAGGVALFVVGVVVPEEVIRGKSPQPSPFGRRR